MKLTEKNIGDRIETTAFAEDDGEHVLPIGTKGTIERHPNPRYSEWFIAQLDEAISLGCKHPNPCTMDRLVLKNGEPDHNVPAFKLIEKDS